jgi:cytidylate kinase
MAERKRDPSFDKRVDKKLGHILKTESAVITSYTLPWLVDDERIIKFWLKGSEVNRARRMANRDSIKVPEAQRIVRMRDQQNIRIYKKLYGFTFGQDLSVFDYALNTDRLSLGALIEVAKLIVSRQVGR